MANGNLTANLPAFKGRMQCFSIQVVMKKCLLLNPEKKFLVQIYSCRFREKRKSAPFNSEKWRHRSEGWTTL